jgi:hypothetical protein
LILMVVVFPLDFLERHRLTFDKSKDEEELELTK